MADDVRKQSDAVAKMAEDWALIDALMGGTSAMRQTGKTYLPQWPAEDPDAYRARLATATLFPAYARTVSVMTGKPFAKPVTVGDDVFQKFLGARRYVDLQNRNLHAFAADAAAEALAFGLCGILVDCPLSTGAKTVADEQRAGLRPYFVHVGHNAILGWRSERVAGNTILTQLRILETVEEPDGEFATKMI